LDIFDGKTSRALRKIVIDLLKEPLSGRHIGRLNARIFELNHAVRELAKGRAAAIFETVSDRALYGGEKFIESKMQQKVRVPHKGYIKLEEWLASKGVELQARLSGNDWTITQLYKARCMLASCKARHERSYRFGKKPQ
jgi:hypothetical protein